MRVSKRWIWAFGVVVAVGVLLVELRNPGGDDLLTVQLIDKDSRQPISASVKIEISRIVTAPCLRFLPFRLRHWITDRTIAAPDGSFRIRRLASPDQSCSCTITINGKDR